MKILVFILLSFTATAQRPACLSYTQKVFDSDTCCWRKFAGSGEFGTSAMLLVDFLQHGKVENKLSLRWHAGQMFAFAGEDRLALHYFRKSYSVVQKWFGGEDGKTWYFFAKGTCSFLKRDKAKLESILDRWSGNLPEDSNFRELKQLLSHWNLSYQEATSGGK